MDKLHNDEALVKNYHKIKTHWKIVPVVGVFFPDTNGTVQPICAVAIGTDFRFRIGRQIRVRGIRVLSTMSQQATNAQSSIRVCLVIDKQMNAVAPAYTDIFSAYSGGSIYNSYNWYLDRFVPLKEWYRCFGQRTATIISEPNVEITNDWVDCDFIMTFGPSASNLPITNGLLLTVGGTGAPGAPTNTTYTFMTEMYFEDDQ